MQCKLASVKEACRQADLCWCAEDTGDLVELINFTHTRKQRLKSIQLRHYTTDRPDVNW